ncbi:signal transducing adapter molecule 1 isoform X2 [Anthonomus grandis grandis]|uniref:signal transducing adapter molecule 1 isoform X2 n=1 Tax=Anthonomus grandis grandis TaxID=2921223 RepID=UPI002166472A|nr:signal transducing adapter molecule 1 isoform X2 [Anthonomus grandis grandis]
MGLFGNTTDGSITEEVESATSDKLVEEKWDMIMNICDKAGKSSDDAKAWLRAITKRLYNSDPHVGLKAVTLLDACVKNSGRSFHMEVASREFETDFHKLMVKAHPQVAKKLRESLKRWAENEFKNDSQLSLIPSLYHKLRSTYDFTSSDTSAKKATPKSNDPNVVESQEEEEQILKAIELSLKETSGSPKTTAASTTAPSSSLYPSVNNMSALTGAITAPVKEPRKVRALYDFEAAEDNELTFASGELIMVLDDSDPNWWKGSNQRGEGLFPANFVTADLSVEPEKFLFEKAKKMVQFKEEVKVVEKEPEEIEINEGKIDRLLHLLHEADPTNPETDTDELLSLEREVNAMGPLIDAELERVDRKHAQLTQLSADLVEALGLYHTLMREPQMPTLGKDGYQPNYGYAPPNSSGMYNGPVPPGMPNNHPMNYQMMPNLPQSGQDRLIYHPQMAGPPPFPMHGMPPQQMMPPASPQMGGMHAPQVQSGMPQPPSQPGGLNQPPNQHGPPGFPPMVDQENMMRFQQGLPSFNMPQPPTSAVFPNGGPMSQTSIQGGPNQPPHFVNSSTHIMH